MLWIYLAILAYLLNSFVFIIDKNLLLRNVSSPLSYAFYVSILSSFVVLLLPFGVHLLPIPFLVVGLASGLSFFIALFFLYGAIKNIDVLEATSSVGAITALATFVFNFLFLHEKIAGKDFMAFALLVAGALILAYFHLTSRSVVHIISSGVLFGFSYTTLKYFFNSTDFINGLFWSRMGLVGGALFLLLIPPARNKIINSFGSSAPRSKTLFLFNKALAAGAFVILYYSIKIGNVVFVNALQGLQYVAVLLFSFLLGDRFSKLFEKHAREHYWRTILGVIFISAGLFVIFI